MRAVVYNSREMMHVDLFVDGDVCYTGEYTDMRINKETIPAGKYVYECRHGDDGDWVTPVTIENRVIVNFAGTFITDTPIIFPTGDLLCVYDWDILEDKNA